MGWVPRSWADRQNCLVRAAPIPDLKRTFQASAGQNPIHPPLFTSSRVSTFTIGLVTLDKLRALRAHFEVTF